MIAGVSTLSGHLTAANKKAISQMLARGITAARTPRICYYLVSEESGVHKVVIEWNESNDWGAVVKRRSSATFRSLSSERVVEVSK